MYKSFLNTGKTQNYVKNILPFVLVIGLAIAVQGWFALNWTLNFNSDEAVHGLLAKHISEGRGIPVNIYGISYWGSLLSILSAPFIRLMGPNVVALRMSNIILLAIFFILHAMLVYHLWGKRVALISLLILALPGLEILNSTSRFYFAIWAVLGTAALVLSQTWFPKKTWLNYLRQFLVGIFLGLGMWTFPIVLIYIFTIAFISLLLSPEWSIIYKKLSKFFEGKIQISLKKLIPVIMICLIGLMVMAIFVGIPAKPCNIARITLLLLAGLSGLTIFLLSYRRKKLALTGLSLAFGFILGYSPALWKFIILGNYPHLVEHLQLWYIFPRAESIKVFVRDVLPALWAIPPLYIIACLSPLQIVFWAFVILIIIGIFISFIWIKRKTLWALFTLSPISKKERKYIILILLFTIPVISLVFHGRGVLPEFVRYLLTAWQAGAVIIAIFVSGLINKSKILGFLLMGLLILQLGSNFIITKKNWSGAMAGFRLEDIAKLEEFLAQNNLQGGYANYWTAYALDFLTEERFIFVSYTGENHYSPYLEKVKAFPIHAYVISQVWEPVLPPEASTTKDLIQEIKRLYPYPFLPELPEHLKKQTVLKREKVANWDVWIISNDDFE